MQRVSLAVAAALAAAFFAPAAQAQQPVKIGVVMTLSGQFADAGNQMHNGIKTYMKINGDTVAGRKIELIVKDVGGPAPDVAKRLAQELVVRDGVDILAGWVLTPNAMAAADVSAEAKKFMVVMNAATSVIITKSPYMIRTSVTLPQVMETFGTWAATKGGIKQSYTMVTDYGPGHDSENAFTSAFKAAGGTIVGSVRFPVANPDFAAFVQREGHRPRVDLHLHPGRRAARGAWQGVRRARHRQEEDQGAGLGRDHRGSGAEEHGRHRPRRHHRLALRLHVEEPREREVREGVPGRLGRAQSRLLLARRLRRHARHLRNAQENERQDRRRDHDRRSQGPQVGQPAWPDDDRPGDARRGAERLYPPRREGRRRAGERAVRHHSDGEGPGRGAPEAEVGDVPKPLGDAVLARGRALRRVRLRNAVVPAVGGAVGD